MVRNRPRHAVQQLRREHGPHEQVRSEDRAGDHHGEHGDRNVEGEKHHATRCILRRPTSMAWDEPRRRHPPDGASPVAKEREQADNDDIVAAHPVVGVGEVDGGDGV